MHYYFRLTRQLLGLEDGVLDTNQAVREQDVEKKIEESSSMSVENSDNSMETSLSKGVLLFLCFERILNRREGKAKEWTTEKSLSEKARLVLYTSISRMDDLCPWRFVRYKLHGIRLVFPPTLLLYCVCRYVTSRLEGTRVILYTKNHRTYLRDTNGNFIASCSSTFPGDKYESFYRLPVECIE